MLSGRVCFFKPNGDRAGAPVDFAARVLGPEEVSLSWSAPTVQGVGPVWGYMLEISPDGASWSSLGFTRATSFLAVGLVERQTYHFRIAAHILFVGNGPVASLTATPREINGLWRHEAVDPVYSWR